MIKRKLKLKWKIIFSILSFLLAIIICMRFIGTKGLMVREYLIKDNIPSSMYGLKVVHFTDLHYGMCVDDDKLDYLSSLPNCIEVRNAKSDEFKHIVDIT